jgi:phosphoglycolate phosphatase-like HAD superfamily hydrolase
LFPVPRLQDVEYSGRTDRAIGLDMLDLHAVETSEQNWSRLREEYLGRLPTFLPRCKGRVLPGIEDLLHRLSRREDIRLGLLTGNLREGARLKLEFYRLMHHFRFGGYGDEHLDRNHVAEAALEAARQDSDGSFDPDRVWVIGDTPLDVRCARWIRARVLAVATGGHSRAELAGCQPDAIADNLVDTERIASWLMTNPMTSENLGQ